jgi:hypothetical protein
MPRVKRRRQSSPAVFERWRQIQPLLDAGATLTEVGKKFAMRPSMVYYLRQKFQDQPVEEHTKPVSGTQEIIDSLYRQKQKVQEQIRTAMEEIRRIELAIHALEGTALDPAAPTVSRMLSDLNGKPENHRRPHEGEDGTHVAPSRAGADEAHSGEMKRTGKTMNEVVVDLIRQLPPAPVTTEFVFDPDDPLWESRLIDELAIKHLKVN